MKPGSPRSKVFAYKSEIDEWLREKTNKIHAKKTSAAQRWAYPGLVSFLAFLTLIFAFLYFSQKQTLSPPFEGLSIAVLPFEILNATEYDEYFSEGLTDQIADKLRKNYRLNVITVPAEVKNSLNSIKKLCKDLPTDYILGAKIEKDNALIKIYPRLIRRKDEKNLITSVFEEKLGNLFFLQNDVCSKIAEKLNVPENLNPTLLPPDKQSFDFEAFDTYLKGNHILRKMREDGDVPWKLCYKGKYYSGLSTKESNDFAINLFYQALAMNQNTAEAYIGLAQCYANNINFGWDYRLSWLEKAEEMLQEANTISPGLPDYSATLIEIYLIEDLEFNKEIKTSVYRLAQEAIQKFPNHPQLNSIMGYCYLRKFGEGGDEADFMKALEFRGKSFWLNIFSPYNFYLSILLTMNQEFELALECLDISKNYAPPSVADYTLGEIYYYKGDLDRSEMIFHLIEMPLEYKVGSLLYRGMIAAQKGEKGKAKKMVDEIEMISPGFDLVFEKNLRLASICMGIGEKELGYKYLKSFFNKEKAKKMRHYNYKLIEIDKNFSQIKNEEEFKKIIWGE